MQELTNLAGAKPVLATVDGSAESGVRRGTGA
jgi:hypothetical protein